MMKILNEMKDMVFILLVTGVFSWVANLINIHPDLGASAIGVFLLVVLASIGIFISKLPGFHKLPMVFWVSIVAVMVSIPGFLPDLSKECKGCVFAPRCSHATERCHKEKPPMVKTGEAGGAACWLCIGGEENGK